MTLDLSKFKPVGSTPSQGPAPQKLDLSKFKLQQEKAPQPIQVPPQGTMAYLPGELGKTFAPVGDFLKGVGSSMASTIARQYTSPTSPISPLSGLDPSGILRSKIQEKIPSDIKTPLGAVSLKYSQDPVTRLKQTGEDILNVLPGGQETKTAEELAVEGSKGAAGQLMKSAFKVGVNDLKKSPTLIKDFLVERIGGWTKKGVAEKTGAMVDTLEGQLDSVIKEASQSGKTIKAQDVVKATDGLVKFYENSAFPEYAEIVKQKIADFVKKGEIPIEEAQQFKKNTYAVLRKSYGQLSAPATEAAKQINRGIKEEIEKAIPDFNVAGINKKIAIFGKARDLMERQINKASGNELLGVKDILTAAPGALKGEPLVAAGSLLVRKILESTPFKTAVANILTSEGLQTVSNLGKISAPILGREIKNLSRPVKGN